MGFAGFNTKRLHVTPWGCALADAAARSALEASLASLLTPAVTKHLPPPLHLNEAGAVGGWMDARDAEGEVLLVECPPEEGALIGLLLLAVFDGGETVHIGYLLGEESWGFGYASELVAGLVEAARGTTAWSRLSGGVAVENPASARVLEKAGFRRVASDKGGEMWTYEIELRP